MLKGKQERKEAVAQEEARRAAEAGAEPQPDSPAPDTELAELEAQIAALEQSEKEKDEDAKSVAEQAAEMPIGSLAPPADQTPTPAPQPAPSAELAELRAEVADLREVVDDLLLQVESLRDFRDKATTVVAETAEEAVRRALESAEPTWLPKVEQVLREVRSIKEASAKADAEVAEVRLYLPRLRQLMQLDEKLARMEKAAQVVESGVARLTAKTPAAAPRPPATTPKDPLAD